MENESGETTKQPRGEPTLEELVSEAKINEPTDQEATKEDFSSLIGLQASIDRTLRKIKVQKENERLDRTWKKLRKWSAGLFLAEGLLAPSQTVRDDYRERPLVSLSENLDQNTSQAIIELSDRLGDNFLSSLLPEKKAAGYEKVYEVLPQEEPGHQDIYAVGEGEEAHAALEIQGFERVGIDNKLVIKIFKQTFPKEWLGDVSAIVYSGKALKTPPEYGLNWQAVATCDGRAGLEIATITYGDIVSTSSDYDILNRILSHEIAHATDPLGHNDLGLEDRVKFMQRLADRVVAPDRFQSFYVESIKNPDIQVERFHRAIEYWATIWEIYLPNPSEAQFRLAPADLDMILDYLKLTAPDFDPELAAEERLKLIAEEDKKIAAIMESLEDIFESKEDRDKFHLFLKLGRRALNYKIPRPGIGVRATELNKDLQNLLTKVKPGWRKLYQNRLKFMHRREALRELAMSPHYSNVLKSVLLDIKMTMADTKDHFREMLKKLPPKEAREAQEFFRDFEELMYEYGDLDWSGTLEFLLKNAEL